MKAKLRIEDFEYSSKAAQESAQRAVAPSAANAVLEARNRQQGQRIARELNEVQQKARQPIENEAALTKSIIQLGAAFGVQPKIERRKKRAR